MYIAACQLSSSFTLIKATEGLQSRNEIAKISNSEVSTEQEVSKDRKKKKKSKHYLETKNPVYYFLGDFSILLLIFALFCFILWGKDIAIELVAGHLAKPSKTLLGFLSHLEHHESTVPPESS